MNIMKRYTAVLCSLLFLLLAAVDTATGGDYADGKLGKALNLVGNSFTVKIPHYAGLKPAKAITISAWIKPEKVGKGGWQWQEIYRKEDGNARALLAIGEYEKKHSLCFGLGIGGKFVEHGAPLEPSKLLDGKWHLVSVTFDGKAIKFYADGQEIGVKTATGSIDTQGEAPAYIGSMKGAMEFFKGGIDDVRLYNRALSAGEMKTMAQADGRAAVNGIVGWWKFDGDLKNSAAEAPKTLLAELEGLHTPVMPKSLPSSWLTYHLAHPGPDNARPADPNCAIYYGGLYHLHYIYQNRGHSFAHVTSKDMVHWEWQSSVLTPPATGHGMYSGTAFLTKEGKPAIIYHGQGSKRNQIAFALDKTLDSWSKPFPVEPKTAGGKPAEMRHWDPDGWIMNGSYYALGGGQNPTLAKSKDLKNWEFLGELLHPDFPKDLGVAKGEDISCANMFKIGDKWMLLCISHGLGARYYLGDFKDEKFLPDHHAMMNWWGWDFFAPESLLTPDGRRVMWSWCTPPIKAWGQKGKTSDFTSLMEGENKIQKGIQSLPRELSLPKDGLLRIKPLRELESLRTNPRRERNITVESNTKYVPKNIAGDTIELEMVIGAPTANEFGIEVLCAEDGSGGFTISSGKGSTTLNVGYIKPPFELAAGEDLTLRIFIDKSMIEVFANNRQAAVAWHEYDPKDLSVRLFSKGGDLKVKSLSAWDMKPIFEAKTNVNLAPVAEPSTSHVSGDTSLAALHDGHAPKTSHVRGKGSYGNWPSKRTQWVQYDWTAPVLTRKIDVFWWDDHGGVRLPKACRVLYWDGKRFVPVRNPSGLGVVKDTFNTTTFDEVRTSKLRLEIDGNEEFSTGILEWKVYNEGELPNFPPSVTAGVDRIVIHGRKTPFAGQLLRAISTDTTKLTWSKSSGPGKVAFADDAALATTATFSAVGDYVLTLTARKGKMSDSSTLAVRVVAKPQLDIRAAGKTGIRITMQPQDSKDTFPYTPALVERDYPKAVISLRELDSAFEPVKARVGQMNVTVQSNPLSVQVTTLDNEPLQKITFAPDGTMSFVLDDQPVLGMGEGGPKQTGDSWRTDKIELDRRGRLHPMTPWYGTGTYGSSNPVPLMVGTAGWGMFIPTPSGAIDLSDSETGRFIPADPIAPGTVVSRRQQRKGRIGLPPPEYFIPGTYDVFVFDAQNPPAFMKDISTISGPAVLPPKWVMGYQQSHRNLRGETQMLEIIDTFRKKNIPLESVCYLGTGFTPSGWNKNQPSFEFNPGVFKRDPKEVLADMHKRNVKVMMHMIPWDRDRLATIQGTIPSKPGETLDNTHIQNYWNEHNALVDAGVDAWWPDEGDWFNFHERMKRHELYYTGPLSKQPNVRPWSLHRNGYLGVARWGGWMWPGDPLTTWRTLETHIAIGINHSLSVSPFWNSDIGAFYTTDEYSAELYVRWVQFAAFNSLMRTHGRGWENRLPWTWGLSEPGPGEGSYVQPKSEMNNPTVEPIAKKYIELRYQLLTYNYTLTWEARETGMPMMRSLWLHYPKDKQARGIGDEYLWGRDMLIAPVYEKGATTRDVYLPAGKWYDWWTGEVETGGRTVQRSVDLATMPIYVRAGAIVPVDPIRQYTSQKVAEPTTLKIYRGADGQFTLYDDDGVSLDYLKGSSTQTLIKWDDSAKTLSIEPASKQTATRTFQVELIPDGVTQLIQYSGRPLTEVLTALSADQGNLKPPSKLLPIPDNLVVLTFDDGNKSDFANVPKVLKKHGFGATFYVTEGLEFLKNPQNYVSWDQIRQLHEMGYEIGNHTQHHRNVTRLKAEEFAASLAHIDKRCAENKITKPVTFCFPGFKNNHASVKVLEKHGFLFARRGVGPEYKDPGKGARGPAYDPDVDDPLLVPTTGYAGPDWKMEDLKWAVDQAEDGKITVLCFHGIPAIEHPWVNTDLKDFEKFMQYLKDEGCTVITMRDLAKYVDPNHRPHKADPYQPIRTRVAEMKKKAAK